MQFRPLFMVGVFGTAVLVPVAGGLIFFQQGRLAVPRVFSGQAQPSALDQVSAAPSLPLRVAARGRVEPLSEEVDLAIGIVGALKAVYVKEGDTIKKGQLLAEVVNDDQGARVTQAGAQVSLRKAEVDKLMHGARPEERAQAAAQLQKTTADLVFAKQQVERRKPLTARGVSSQEAWDQAVSSLQVAQAAFDGSHAASELINAPPRSEDVSIAQANLALAEANLQEQRALLEKTQLRSPVDGTVLRRYLKTGETISIQPLMPIVQVGDTHRLRVRTEVDETEVGEVRLGQIASVRISAYPDRGFSGTVVRIGQKMGRKTVWSDDPAEKHDTNILDVLIDLDQAGVALPVGLRVNVFLNHGPSAQN